MNQKEVTTHFNKIAKDYDTYKKNHFYYTSLVKWELGKRIPKGVRILDYGCGTGDILNFLSPASGVGFDPSREMIKIAKNKFKNKKNLSFTTSLKAVSGKFDYVISVDTIEHFADPNLEFKKMSRFMNRKTKLVISYVDSNWEWLINTLSLIRPKTPEGPHKRITRNEVVRAAKNAGLRLQKAPNLLNPVGVFIFGKRSK